MGSSLRTQMLSHSGETGGDDPGQSLSFLLHNVSKVPSSVLEPAGDYFRI